MFRTRKFNTCPPSPKEFVVPINQQYYTDDGTKCSRVVYVNSSSIASNLPKSQDYKLSALINAGVPLNFVSSNILDAAPSESEVSSLLDKLSSNPQNNE